MGRRERETWYKKYKNKRNEETSDRGLGESTKRRNIGWRSTNDLQWWKKEVIIKTIETKKEGQCEQNKTGQQPTQKQVISNQKQTLNNNTPEEKTRNQTSQRNLNEYVILKEKNNRENINATTQQNSKPNRKDKGKVREKNDAGYNDNDQQQEIMKKTTHRMKNKMENK